MLYIYRADLLVIKYVIITLWVILITNGPKSISRNFREIDFTKKVDDDVCSKR